MDEISFGPPREARPPPGRGRALTVAVSLAGIAAAGVALAVDGPAAYHSLASPYAVSRPAAPSASPARLPSPGCRPAHPAWPSLARLPAGLRPGALPVIVDAQFSGRCALVSPARVSQRAEHRALERAQGRAERADRAGQGRGRLAGDLPLGLVLGVELDELRVLLLYLL
jgi:hypothetical protein